MKISHHRLDLPWLRGLFLSLSPRMCLIACALTASSACTPRAAKSEAAAETPMARDLHRICNAEELSGALDKQPGDRAMHTGIWLATNLESQQARDLSAELSPMPAPTRGKRLKEDLARHGITECEILHAWGAP